MLGREDVKSSGAGADGGCSFPLTGNSERMRVATVRGAEVLQRSPLFTPERNDGAASEARAAPKGLLKVSTEPLDKQRTFSALPNVLHAGAFCNDAPADASTPRRGILFPTAKWLSGKIGAWARHRRLPPLALEAG